MVLPLRSTTLVRLPHSVLLKVNTADLAPSGRLVVLRSNLFTTIAAPVWVGTPVIIVEAKSKVVMVWRVSSTEVKTRVAERVTTSLKTAVPSLVDTDEARIFCCHTDRP